MPHFKDELLKKIEEEGCSPLSITKVFITHQDIDHFGNALYFSKNGAKIYASELDVPYIEGKLKLEKLVSLEEKEGHRNFIEEGIYQVIKENTNKCSVDVNVQLKGNEKFDFCGGISTLDLRGHTPGHLGFFLNKSKILIVGDAAEIIDGKLVPPDKNFCSDPNMALLSFEKINTFKSNGIVCYHGGFIQS